MVGVFKYFPVYGGPYLRVPVKVATSSEKPLFWWKKGALVYHPYLLISYGIEGQIEPSAFVNIRHYLGAEEAEVVADSGGLQQVTLGKVYDPVKVFKWQEKNADYGFILDYPPAAVRRTNNYTFDDLKKAADQTLRNIKAIRPLAKNSELKVYGILQGHSLEYIEYWWENVLEPNMDIFYGIAFASRPEISPHLAAYRLRFLYEKGVKRVHALALSSLSALILLTESLDYFEVVSTDSSAATIKTGFGKFVLYRRYVKMIEPYGGRKGVRMGYDKYFDFCRCRVCEYARSLGYRPFLLRNIQEYTFLTLHNLLEILNYLQMLLFVKYNGKSITEFIEPDSKTKEALECLHKGKCSADIGMGTAGPLGEWI